MSSIEARVKCPKCVRTFKNRGDMTQHFNRAHQLRSPPKQRSPAKSADSSSSRSGSPSQNPPFHADGDFPDFNADQHGPSQRTPSPKITRRYHAQLNARPCNENGDFLPANTPPPPPSFDPQDFDVFDDRIDFEIADFLYREVQMSEKKIDKLFALWEAHAALKYNGTGPYESKDDLYDMIDSIEAGAADWKCLTVSYRGEKPANAPSWMEDSWEVWYRDPKDVIRNMLENEDFDGEFDYVPYEEYGEDGERVYENLMSGDWAWIQSDKIAKEIPAALGALLVPIILGSDKTVVSVGTGNNEFLPLYMSIGNIANNVRRAHRESVIPIGFLAIPKGGRQYDKDKNFLRFRRQLYHTSLTAILQTLKPAMTTPEVFRCPDGHFRRVLFELGPYIADYPEQVLLACVVQGWCPKCTSHPSNLDDASQRRTADWTDSLVDTQNAQVLWDAFGIISDVIPFTNYFPRADIHQLLSPDLLHQIIKGTFKDHLVTWVEDYLKITHGNARAGEIMDEIDKRLAATPSFPGLRRFSQGRRFKQWTGDDSKALMKIYLPCLEGYLPPDMLRCFAAFLDFCYLVRRSKITTSTLNNIDEALGRFHRYRDVFITSGVRSDFSLPRQHSLGHYTNSIRLFGAPNGLCTSITESKHVKAVKAPWRRSSRYKALGQMITTNSRLDKLGALQARFKSRGMLKGTILDYAFSLLNMSNDEDGEDGEDDEVGVVEGPRTLGSVKMARTPKRGYPRQIHTLAAKVNYQNLPELVRQFLFDQLHPDSQTPIPDTFQPSISGLRFDVYHSADVVFYAPSDLSGIGGMRRERIRSSPNWRGEGPRHDCVFAEEDVDLPGMRGLRVLRVMLLFSFRYQVETYPCALVQWFSTLGDCPDEDIGLWVVQPDCSDFGHRRNRNPSERDVTVVHLDTILRCAHLLPRHGAASLPPRFHHSYSLDAFDTFYVNKYADHQANEIAF